MKKGKVKLTMNDGGDVEVEASIMSPQWAIHKDINSSQYVLTHIPSGKRAWSSHTQLSLKRLIQEPEFLVDIDAMNKGQLVDLAGAIARFCDKETDLEHKPRKIIGWG